MSADSEQAGLLPSRITGLREESRTPDTPSEETFPLIAAGAAPDQSLLLDAAAVPSEETESFRTARGTRDTVRPVTAPSPATGPSHIGGFKLIEKVHQSRMSAVWRAVDEARQTSVALKLVPLDLAPNFDLQTLARLIRVSAHPGLVRLLDHGREGAWWYQVAEWVNGETLESWCLKTPVHWTGADTEFSVLMREIASALSTYHGAGFVHGDVKPSNVLVVDGHARLVDLVGMPIGACWNRQRSLTPAFASPESRDGAPADPRDDVYSLAAMIVHLKGGRQIDPARPPDTTTQPPSGSTASQWSALQIALDPVRGSRTASAIALVSAVWRDSSEQEGAKLPATPRASALNPAVRVLPLRIPRRTGAKLGLAAVAAAVAVVLGIDDKQWELATSALQVDFATPTLQLDFATSAFFLPASAGPVITPIPSQTRPLRDAQFDRATSQSNFQRARVRESTSVRDSLDNTRDTPLPLAQAERTESHLMSVPASSAPAADGANGGLAVRPRLDLAAVRTVAFMPDRRRRTTVENPQIAPDLPGVPEAPVGPTAPEHPDLLPTPQRPDVPAVPTRPDVPAVPARPDTPAKPERPEVAAIPERPDIPAVPERPDKPDKPERPDTPAKPERPDVAAIPERPDIPAVPERPNRPDKPDKPDKPTSQTSRRGRRGRTSPAKASDRHGIELTTRYCMIGG